LNLELYRTLDYGLKWACLVMFELFLAEPHLKHSITSLKVTAYATFY